MRDEGSSRSSYLQDDDDDSEDEDELPLEERWKEDENSRYEYRLMIEEHVFFVLLPFLVDFLKIDRPLTRDAGGEAPKLGEERSAGPSPREASIGGGGSP